MACNRRAFRRRRPFELIGQMPSKQTMVHLVERPCKVTAAFDGRFDDIWQELLVTCNQSLVDASSDKRASQKTSHKSMVIWR